MVNYRLFCSCSLVAIIAIMVHVPASGLAAVNPTDFMTITPIRDVSTGTTERCWYGGINSPSFKYQALSTLAAPGGSRYQFTSYYSNQGKLVVGRRKQLAGGWSDWTLDKTEFTTADLGGDGHRGSSIGIDGSGILHVSWGMHNDDMLYTRSNASVLNDGGISLIGGTVGNSDSLKYEFPLNSQVTYPQFYNIPGNDDLLMSYRTGYSGNGNMQLSRWSNSSHVWSGVHASSSQPWISKDYLFDSLPDVSAYINPPVWDSQGNLHVTWTWRTSGDYQTNHNIMYAWSPNQGIDWYRQDDTLYQRWGNHAIDEDNAPPVISLPEGSSLINQTGMAVGPDDTIYTASWWAPNAASGDDVRQYMLSWFDGISWQVSQITNREVDETSSLQRPAVAVDDDNRVLVVFSDGQRDKQVSIAISESLERNDWQIFDLEGTYRIGDEPVIDLNRWHEDGVLSMLYCYGYDMQVLEWDARSYFATVPEPSVWIMILSGILVVWGLRKCRSFQQ